MRFLALKCYDGPIRAIITHYETQECNVSTNTSILKTLLTQATDKDQPSRVVCLIFLNVEAVFIALNLHYRMISLR